MLPKNTPQPSQLYIAYGSNLNRAQMAERCPNAKPVGPGVLEGYKLVFRAGGQGVYLTVEPEPGRSVPVGLWEVTLQDEAALDEYEGYPQLYYRERLPVSFTREDGRVCRAAALVYIMFEHYPLAAPGQEYVEACLQGYRDFGLDEGALMRAVEEANKE